MGGVNGAVAGTFTYTPAAGTVLNAGAGQTLSVTFTPTDTTDYNTAVRLGHDQRRQGHTHRHLGQPRRHHVRHRALGRPAQCGVVLDGGRSQWTCRGDVHLHAGRGHRPERRHGTDSLGHVHAHGHDQLQLRPRSVTINVAKATPNIAWANPADITYGTALSATQLDATSSWTVGGVNGPVAGTFTYTPAAGTVLNAGPGQTLSVTFTPTDTTDYSIRLRLGRRSTSTRPRPPSPGPTPPTSPTAPRSRPPSSMRRRPGRWPESREAVAGTFTYTPAAGTVLNAGTGQTLSVTFTPTDSTDYSTASASATINVAKATPMITWANPADITYGTALSATQLDATSSWTVAGVNGSVAGTFTYTPAAGTVLNAGPDRPSRSPSQPTDAADYNPTSATATVTVLPTADLAITQFTAAPKTVQIGDDLTYTIVVINNGPYPATAVKVTSPLGAGASYVTGSGTATPSGAVNLQGSSVVASLGTLAPGASATVTFMVVPSLIATLTGTASVTSNEVDTDTSNNSATVSTTVVDRVGTIEFSAAGYAVPENAGSATITVNRVNGTRGTVTVDYRTVPINATPGRDFTPVSGTLTFPNGVTSQTIVVPVLANPYDNRDELVSVVLSNVQTTETLGQAILGTPSTATLTIQDIDPDFNPVIVSGVQWTGTAQSITQIFVTFSKPLITSTAINPANYALVNVGPDGKYGTLDDSGVAMSVAMYPSSTSIVALTPAQPLPANRFFHLWINGGTPGGVEDLGDNMLAGDGSHRGHQLHRHAGAWHEPEVFHPGRRPGEPQDHRRRHHRRPADRLGPGGQALGGRRGSPPHGPLGQCPEGSRGNWQSLSRFHALGTGQFRRCPREDVFTAVPGQPVSVFTRLCRLEVQLEPGGHANAHDAKNATRVCPAP